MTISYWLFWKPDYYRYHHSLTVMLSLIWFCFWFTLNIYKTNFKWGVELRHPCSRQLKLKHIEDIFCLYLVWLLTLKSKLMNKKDKQVNKSYVLLKLIGTYHACWNVRWESNKKKNNQKTTLLIFDIQYPLFGTSVCVAQGQSIMFIIKWKRKL